MDPEWQDRLKKDTPLVSNDHRAGWSFLTDAEGVGSAGLRQFMKAQQVLSATSVFKLLQ